MSTGSPRSDTELEDALSFKCIPSNLLRYVDKYIKITSVSGKTTIEGVCYSVDPVTKSPLLLTAEDGQCVVKIMPGHLVGKIEFTDNDENEKIIRQHMAKKTRSKVVDPDSVELSARRKSLLSWLQKNRIPVKEEGKEITMGSVLRILPPYTVDSVITPKETVLKKVIDLMETISV